MEIGGLEMGSIGDGLEMKERIGDGIKNLIGDGLEIGSIGDDIKERIGDRIGWR